MSGFDASLLEGKDRAELAAIAEQLGQKPGARAKKSEIVALIMRLVGADAAEAPADADDETPTAHAGDDGGHATDSGEAAADADGDQPTASPGPENGCRHTTSCGRSSGSVTARTSSLNR